MTFLRKAVIAAGCATLAALAPPRRAAADDLPRIDVRIYEYTGVENSDEHEKAFSAFLALIRDRLLTLSGELSALDDHLAYVRQLTRTVVKDANGRRLPFEGTQQTIADYWKNPGTLSLLFGRVGRDGPEFHIRSEVYVGDLKGALPRPEVTLDLAIDKDDFELASEAHTVVTIYALAMDAERRGVPRETVLALLSRADVYSQGDDPSQSMAELRRAIQASLASLRGAVQ